MRASNVTSEPRIKVKLDKTKGVQSFDIDNNYPARIDNIISHSGTATSCVNLYAKFIIGDGFKDKKFWKSKINEDGLTIDKLLRYLAKDYAKHHGFAIHIGYNILLKKAEFTYVPFAWCRKGELDDELYSGKIIVYNNWDKSVNEKINKAKFVSYDIYNSNEAVVAYQIEKAGGIEKYRGQIFYFSNSEDVYPRSPIDPVLEDCQTDAEIKAFRLRDVTTNFMASHMIEYPYEFESENEREQELKRWENMQGSRQACKMNVVENPLLADGKTSIKVTKFDNQTNDKQFESTVRTTKDSIIECFGQPPILLGVAVAGKLGTSGEIADAFEFYNNYTLQDRRVFEEAFIELCKETSFNPSNDFTILTLNFGATNAKPALIETLGVGGVTALATILQSPLDPNQKINTLKIVFGLTLEESQSIVLGTNLTTT
jgi:hypothetical protein